MTDTKGLPVAGYKATQPQAAIDLVNENKLLEERVLRQIEKHTSGKTVQLGLDVDPRMAAEARTHIQAGFMWLNRAVFQPGRVELDDNNA